MWVVGLVYRNAQVLVINLKSTAPLKPLVCNSSPGDSNFPARPSRQHFSAWL